MWSFASRPFRSAALTATLTAALLLAGLPAAGPASAHTDRPTPGAAGIGDRLYPTLGNGGYDALHYWLGLRYATSAPSQGIDGTLTLLARATQSLSRFDLDFAGTGLGSVAVNGAPAGFSRVGEDIVITPRHAIRRGSTFTVTVRHFTATPTEPDPDQFLSTAFFTTPDGSATSGQPNAMHFVFPSNDHPRDKAGFSFRFDVPSGETAVANGVLTGRRTVGDRTFWSYEQPQPMATELTQLVVGRFTVLPRGSVNGVPVRDVVPTRLLPQYRDLLGIEKSQIQWMEERVGRYPFDLYGSLIVDTHLGFALETQTLSLFDTPWFNDFPPGVWEPTMLHELSHQWFGDDVAPHEWSDVWLNEGHASWYEFLYADQRGELNDDVGEPDFTTLMQVVYGLGDIYRQRYGPVAQPTSGDVNAVFSNNAYFGGALVLYALQQKIGADAFQRLERAWVHTYAGRSASTADFIALASRASGQNLTGFLRAWLYGTSTPPMPGHPDWTVRPVPPPAAAPAAAPLASLALPSGVGRH